MRRLARRHSHDAGLTLVEVVVALSIIGVLLALAVGGQSLLANRYLTGTARKLASDLRVAEQRARTERTCYRIVFDPDGEAYTIQRYTGAVTPAPPGGGSQCASDAWSPEPTFREEAGEAVSRRMPRGVDLVSTTFASHVLIFSPLGNPNAGTVTLRSPSGQERQVVIEVFGRVRIQP